MNIPSFTRAFSFNHNNASTSSLKQIVGSLIPRHSSETIPTSPPISADSLSSHPTSPPHYFEHDDNTTNPFLSEESAPNDTASNNLASDVNEEDLWLMIYSCQWQESRDVVKQRVDDEFDRLWQSTPSPSSPLSLGYEPSFDHISSSSSGSSIRSWASTSIKLPTKTMPLRERHENVGYSPGVTPKNKKKWWNH